MNGLSTCCFIVFSLVFLSADAHILTSTHLDNLEEEYAQTLAYWEGRDLSEVAPSKHFRLPRAKLSKVSHDQHRNNGEPLTFSWNDTTGFPAGTSEVPKQDYAMLPFSAMGRVVGHDGGANDDFACSASVIWPGVLLTAGHCCGGNGYFYEKIVFQPHYSGGCFNPDNSTFPCSRNVTLLPVSNMKAYSNWINDAEWAYDYCFAQVALPTEEETNPLGLRSPVGRSEYEIWSHLANAGIGTLGLTVNLHQFDVVFTACGYPAESPFPGDKNYCTTNAGTSGGSGTYKIPSKLNEGSSGGPWVIGAHIVDAKNASSYTNHVNGLNSHVFEGELDMYSPIFVTDTWTLYQSLLKSTLHH